MKPENRVLLAFKSWEIKKNELSPVIKTGTTDEHTLRELQLTHLQQARHRLKDTLRPDEQPFMALLDNNISRLEKQLFPNLLQRLFFQLKNYLLDGPAYINQQNQQRTANLNALKNQLRESGLGSVAGELERHIDQEVTNVRIPLNCQLSAEKWLTIDLHFEKDVYGDFQIRSLNGSLSEKGRTPREYDFNLAEWPGLRSDQVLSLLEGRALKQQFTDVLGQENHRWVELGVDGPRYYPTDHSFDVASAHRTLPNITRNPEELIRYLENGQQIPTHWKHEGYFQSIYVQADPANGTLKLFDARQRPITPEQLNKNARQQQVMKAPVLATAPRRSIKNGHQVH